MYREIHFTPKKVIKIQEFMMADLLNSIHNENIFNHPDINIKSHFDDAKEKMNNFEKVKLSSKF